ncbi:MAG: hypothetical protein ACHQ16_04110 [Candidatus Lutacidiplasmatales archaeon]
MDLRKVRRLAEVLVASQLRAGGSNTNPKSFLGRPSTLLLVDAVAFVALFGLTLFAGQAVQSARPGVLAGLVGSFLPFLPLLAVASALVGGLTFELATTAKFANSDAVNWLPIRSLDYTLASSLGLTLLYSLSVVILAAVALGLGIVTGTLPIAVLAVVLGFAGLLEGALLIEIVRGVTQRAGALGRKRGSTALILRAAVFLAVVLGFELFFNPVILLDSLRAFGSLGPIALVVPLLWGSDAILAAVEGNLLVAAAATLGQFTFLALTAVAAARIRSRFWVQSGGEVVFDRHTFGERHRGLRALGLGPAAAALVAKDLRGLVRRRELMPGLLLPFVIGIILLVQTRTAGGGGSPVVESFQLGLLAWVAGLSALLLSSSSFGQERRGIVHLYTLPLRPREVFRAKAAATLLVALPVGLTLTALGLVVFRPSPMVAVALLLLVGALVFEATAIGLAFAARYSDYQDRPRPQFVRSIAMLAATGVYFLLGGATTVLAVLLVTGLLPPSEAGPAVLLGGALVFATVVLLAWLGSSGVARLLREIPV